LIENALLEQLRRYFSLLQAGSKACRMLGARHVTSWEQGMSHAGNKH